MTSYPDLPSAISKDQGVAFQVHPYGDRWAIMCGDEVLAFAATERDAAQLAIKAAGILHVTRVELTTVEPEPRSFGER